MIFVVVAVFSFILNFSYVRAMDAAGRECLVKKSETIDLPPMYQQGERSLETAAYRLAFDTNGSDTMCFFSIDTLFSFEPSKSDEIKTVIFVLECQPGTTIKIMPSSHGNQRQDHVCYLQLDSCRVSKEDLSIISNDFCDLKVVNLLNTLIASNVVSPFKTKKHFLSSAASLMFMFNTMQSVSVLLDLLDDQNVFLQMKEIILEGWNIPDLNPFEILLRKKFPRLESLIVKNSFLKSPVSFPWFEGKDPLPMNLSRTTKFQEQYASRSHIQVEPYHFSRHFQMENTSITNLDNFEFSGQLHYVSLKGNYLTSVTNSMFKKVSGLNCIDLSHNNISFIPSKVFENQSDLRFIDLSYNNLQEIPWDVFKNKQKLKRIVLSNNDLTNLPPKLFTDLETLEYLDLQDNALTFLEPKQVLPMNSVNFRSLILDNNPIKRFPWELLYISNLWIVDVKNTNINKPFEGLEQIQLPKLSLSISDSSITDYTELLQLNEYRRTIDMSNSDITNLGFPLVQDKKTLKKIAIILYNYNIRLNNNSLQCSTDMGPFIKFRNDVKEILKVSFDFLKWTCRGPLDDSSRQLGVLQTRNLYCPVKTKLCPHKCTCYRRGETEQIVVDCRKQNITNLPHELPAGRLSLLFQSNNIGNISNRNYMEFIEELHLENNSISVIEDGFFQKAKSLKVLNLKSNYLHQLPLDITFLTLNEFYAGDNQLECNCRMIKVKDWLIKNRNNIIGDTSDLTCKAGDGNIYPIISAPGDKFTCSYTYTIWEFSIRILLPMLGTLCFLVRDTLKKNFILILVYLGHKFSHVDSIVQFVHWCLRNPPKDEKVCFSLFYDQEDTQWVIDNIKHNWPYGSNAYEPVDYNHVNIAGFTYVDTVHALVYNSLSVILVVSNASKHTPLFQWVIEKASISKKWIFLVIRGDYEMQFLDVVKRKCRKFFSPFDHHAFIRGLTNFATSHNILTNNNHANIDLKKEILLLNGQVQSVVHPNENTIQFLYVDGCTKTKTIIYKTELQLRSDYQCIMPDSDMHAGQNFSESVFDKYENSQHTIVFLDQEANDDRFFSSILENMISAHLNIQNKLIFVICYINNSDMNSTTIEEFLKSHVCINADSCCYLEELKRSLSN